MFLVMYKILFSLIIAHIFVTVHAQTYVEMDSLLGYLFNESRYNKNLRPVWNQSQVMKVNLTQYLSSIEYVDISSGELLISGFFEITWTDELLKWDPSLYQDKETLSLPKNKFWKPELSIRNGPANQELSIYNTGFSPTWASYEGSVISITGGSYKTRCNVDTTLYPYDIHTCYFNFIVSNHDTTELMLNSPTGDIQTSDLKENGEWEIKNTNTKVVVMNDRNVNNVSVPMLQNFLSLKRRPTFEIINIFAPINLISSLNILTCFVRPDSGERLTFAVTLYLSLVFVTTSAIGRIPNNSLKMPYMAYEVLVINFINTIGVTWSIFIVHLASKPKVQQRLPARLVKMVMKKRQLQTFKSQLKPGVKSVEGIEPVENEDSSNENQVKEKEDQTAEYVHVNDITGLEVAENLDKIYFWSAVLFFSVLYISFGALIFIWVDKIENLGF